jgi:hypothetical protein
MRWLFVALIAFFVASAAGQQEKPRHPIDELVGNARFSLLMCELESRLVLEVGASTAKLSQCVGEGLDAMKKALPAAQKAARKPQLRSAVNAFYAAGVSALQGRMVKSDDTRLTYKQRQDRLEEALNAAQAKIEAER